MSSLAKPISWVFYTYLKFQGAQWLAGLGLAWYGLIAGKDDPTLSYPWWIAAAAVVAGYWVAEACGFALFIREPDHYAGTRHEAAPSVTYGVAAGDFDAWDHLRIRYPMRIVGADVQIRWMGKQRVPELAVLSPRELEPTLLSPLESAEASSLWYEGSHVSRGRVYIAGKEYPGVRFRFLGRQMLLGLESEEEAAAIAHTIEEEF